MAGENVWTDPRLGIGQGGVEVRRGRERLFPVRLHGGFFQNRKRSYEEGLAGRRQGEKAEAGSRPILEAEELVSAPPEPF